MPQKIKNRMRRLLLWFIQMILIGWKYISKEKKAKLADYGPAPEDVLRFLKRQKLLPIDTKIVVKNVAKKK